MSIRELYRYEFDKPNCNLIVNSLVDNSTLSSFSASTTLSALQFFNGFVQVPSTAGPGVTLTSPSKALLDTFLTLLFGTIPVGYSFKFCIVNNSATAIALAFPVGYNVLDPATLNVQPNTRKIIAVGVDQTEYVIYG